jgi:hypothetical protein
VRTKPITASRRTSTGAIIEVTTSTTKRKEAEGGLPLDIVERVEPVPLGQRRRGREAEEHADPEQEEHAAERPAVDRAPPSGKDGLSRRRGIGPMDHFGHGNAACRSASSRPFAGSAT